MNNNDSFLNTLKNHRYTQKVIKIIYETPAEIYLGGLIAGALTFGYNVVANSNNRIIPLSFSEVEKARRNAKKLGVPLPAESEYLSLTNDVAMKVFEADNESQQWYNPWTGKNEAFARELEKKTDPAFRVHATLKEHTDKLAKLSAKTLEKVEKMTDTQDELVAISDALSKSWDVTNEDFTKIIETKKTICDSTGKNCKDIVTKEEVYDHTDHHFDYHKKYGKKAASLLKDFAQKHPDMNIPLTFVPVTQTEADNENAIHHSIEQFKDKYPSQDEYLKMANIWISGSNIKFYMPQVSDNYAHIMASVPEWDSQSRTAHDKVYTDESATHPGPQQYQTANAIHDYADNMNSAIDNVTDGIDYTGKNAPVLSDKAIKLVNAALHHQPGDVDQLASDVRNIAQTMYRKNFVNGLDTENSPWGKIALMTLAGTLLGAAAGGAVDYYLNKKRPPSNPYNRNYV